MATNFNPREHLIQIKNRQGAAEYLPVQYRLVWFRELCPQGTIETELVHLDLDKETEEETYAWNAEKRRSEKVLKTAKGIAIFRATVKDGKGGVATATKMERAASFSDYLEKSETGAIGRALAALGYGTQFTADELNEMPRIVDAPVDRTQPTQTNGNGHITPVHTNVTPVQSNNTLQETGITEEQLSSIRKLCERLNKNTPENVTTITYNHAKEVIRNLTGEYREMKQREQNKAS